MFVVSYSEFPRRLEPCILVPADVMKSLFWIHELRHWTESNLDMGQVCIYRLAKGASWTVVGNTGMPFCTNLAPFRLISWPVTTLKLVNSVRYTRDLLASITFYMQ